MRIKKMSCERCVFCLLLVTLSLVTGSYLLPEMIEYNDRHERSIGRIEVVYPSIETLSSGNKRVTFTAMGQDIELNLEPGGDVISDDFTVISGDDGEVDNSVDVQNLKRKLYRDPEVGAALYIDEDGPLIINGIVNSELRIQPVTWEKEASENGRIPHRVIELINNENYPIDSKTVSADLRRSVKRELSDDEYININYLFVADPTFTESFENREDTMETYLSNIMNIIQEMYDSLKLGIKATLGGIIKITKENEAEIAPFLKVVYADHPNEVNGGWMLGEFGRFYKTSTDPLVVNADVVILVTRRRLGRFDDKGNFRETMGGVAYVNTVCNNHYKFAVTKHRWTTYEYVLIHESTHILGCGDYPDPKTCPRTGLHGFSECCKRDLENKLIKNRKHCVIEKYSEQPNHVNITV